MTSRQIKVVAILVPILLLLAGFFGSKYFASLKKEPPRKPISKVSRRVASEIIQYSTHEVELQAFGRVASSQSLTLGAEVPGRLISGEVALKVGQVFKKGQVLFRIDDREFTLQLKARKAEFLRLLSNILPDYKLDFPDTYQPLLDFYERIKIDRPLPAVPKLDSRQLTYLSSQQVVSLYYQIQADEERLEKHTYIAPFNGSIAELNQQEGAFVSNASNIGRIIRTDEMEVELPIKLRDISWIKKGQSLALQGEQEGEEWNGQISRVSDFVDPRLQAVNIYVKVKKSETKPLPYEGMYLRANIPGRRVEKAMRVSRRALYSNNQVYMVKNEKLYKQTINLLRLDPETFLFNGLTEGDTLIVEALTMPIEGASVTSFFNN